MNAHPSHVRPAPEGARPVLARITPPAQPLGPWRFLSTVVRNPLEAWPETIYREPVYTSTVLGNSSLFVMAPNLIRRVMVDDADAFEKSEVLRRALSPALGDAILTADGARWRWQRRAAAPIFRAERIRSFVPAMIAAAERTRDALAADPGAEVDLAQTMMRTTFEIIVETMLPGAGGIDAARVERGITDYLESTSWVVALTLLRAPAWLPFPGRAKAERAKTYLRDELLRLAAEGRRTGTEGRNDLLSLLLAARDPETGQAMDDRDVADNLLTFVTAGHETTALALTWALYLLSHHPESEALIAAEVEAATAGGPLAPEHVDALPYTRQVILEAMRLYPPVPVVVRAALRDVDLDGIPVRAGTPITIPIYAVHRHAALWDEPERFDPARFAPEAAKARDRYAYLPFAAGPRICIGMGFALSEAVAILAVLVRSLRFSLRPGYLPVLKQRITLRPSEGMPMRVSRR
ncbi:MULTISPECIES: cytochrome P450 [Methylobacterium]|jgi:cytochrome P450|uniref:Cytochrome P450 n=1 Tax=Methylobacterium ajmalii TaxID=2738439 RepID=A0ABU9ZSP8_9HYPH|nr:MULTISPECIES: cytochrome P450 [Methylobacterium]MBK3397594.1 cytochrome P450 [Methylobacterium ajmalii]MBK3411625.1 cytochrome P450 [Methylobacterium ajmalii]MBK3423412.1 cytochrome P450 [Methylobacterium ajmalii]MBZ6416556.1 cytochrome P450 [Methylobacterium sp.]SFF49150.1 Cytochrome P450 [Methylobacterium sp. yr596]